jgi:hypothetical protein
MFMEQSIAGTFKKHDGSVDIATGWTIWVRFTTKAKIILICSVQTGPGIHPAPDSMGTGGLVVRE